MRELIQRHSLLISVISVTVMVVVFSIKFLSSAPSSEHNSDNLSEDCWYYDLATDEYVRDRIDRIPPFVSKQGAEQVRVVFFSCGGCNKSEWFPGYYLKYSSQLVAKVQADPAKVGSLHGESVQGRMFSFDAKNWVTAPDAETAGVFKHHKHRCDGVGALKMCR